VNGDAFDSLMRALARRQSRRITVTQLSAVGLLASVFGHALQPSARAVPSRQAGCWPWTICGESCVDLQTDPLHCGACDVACGLDEACFFGACGRVTPCDGPLTLCGDRCVDLQSDHQNCGACGAGCQNWEHCTAGVCIEDPLPACPSGLERCDDFCVDLMHDDEHCGGCGSACEWFLEECRDGRCVVVEEPHIPR
jgi:hypothetical protein